MFLRYCIVGAGGFLCDAGLLALLLKAGMGPYAGRLVSIFGAISLTWMLNRRFTFRSERAPGWREFLRYQSLNGLGAALNYAVYAMLVHVEIPPLPALAVASGAALLFNYIGNLKLVFARP